MVQGDVSIGFPFNEQLPNVARINEAYSFTMSNETYRSPNGLVNYQANDLPEWLSFDQGSRTFTGTPSDDDVGEFQISLTGTDPQDQSSVITRSYSMMVSNDTGLHLSSSDVMFVQISQYGRTNGVDGLVVQEGDDVNIQFSTDVFEEYKDSDNSVVAYYGTSMDRSSLPNWIKFDSDSRSFVGTVPYVNSQSAPSYEYGFSFIGTDYIGYAGAVGNFKLVVGGHQLSTDVNETIKVNGTLENDFDITVPILSKVYLDGEVISRDNITSVEGENLPDYVNFNSDDYSLTGNFPDEGSFDNFTIKVNDIYGNYVKIPYLFDAIGSVFTVDELSSFNATKGEYFSHQLMDSLFTDKNDTTVNANFDADWLNFHQDNLTFNGNVPEDFDELSVDIDASSSFDSETKSLSIRGVDSVEESSSSSSSSSSSEASETGGGGAVADDNSDESDEKSDNDNDVHKKLAIGLGVGIPLFLILIAALLFCCCFMKRRRRKQEDKEKAAVNPDDSGDTTLENEDGEITGPGIGVSHPTNGQSPQYMASMNVLKMEDKKNGDNHSTSSSLTHVESNDVGSRYFDASAENEANEDFDKPIKSWRANDVSDVALAGGGAAGAAAGLSKSGNIRKSDASLNTVNTEQLFSVRLVEDNSILRASDRTSFGSGQFISNNSLNALLHREDSGNIQRLDSEGNIVDEAGNKLTNSGSTNLGVLPEHSNENTKDYSSEYHSLQPEPIDNNFSTANILGRPGIVSNKSENSLSKSSVYDDFKATPNGDGNFEWSDITPENHNYHSNDYKYLNTGSNLRLSETKDSLLSVSTNNSSEILRPTNAARISNSSLGKKAKLVDFTTRRSSLRESSRAPYNDYHGEDVEIRDGSD